MTSACIMQIVAKVCGVTVEQMQSNTSKQVIVHARFIATMMMVELGLKQKHIIAQFPNHDRTMINYRLKSFNDLIAHDKPFKALYLSCQGLRAEMDNDL